MEVFGHRGNSALAPENTLKAFELAHRDGAHGIELDVQLTADNAVVVTHDFTLERVSSGSGPVAAKTLAQLKELDFGGEKIPTLDEVLDFITGTELRLNIEIKSVPYMYDTELTRLAAEKITSFGLTDRIIVSSFDHSILPAVKELCGVKTGILYMSALHRAWAYAKIAGADYIHPYHPSLTAECVTGCHAHGIGVNAWTADEPEEILRLAAIGADAVIANNPGAVLRLLG